MRTIVALVMSIVSLMASSVQADPARTKTSPLPAPYMRVFSITPPPQGYVRFCAANRGECVRDTRTKQRFPTTPQHLSELDEVNRYVNKVIQPSTDQDLYGVEEYWTLPAGRGDCEDYALLKRQILLAKGWPASALLLTVVRDQQGEGHAVLTARTDHGDFILDNKDPMVKLWHQTPYRYVMRQSYLDPMTWMSLDPEQNWQTTAVTTTQPDRHWQTRTLGH